MYSDDLEMTNKFLGHRNALDKTTFLEPINPAIPQEYAEQQEIQNSSTPTTSLKGKKVF